MGKLHIQFEILFKTRIRFIVGGGHNNNIFKKSNIYIQAASPLEIRRKKNRYAGFVGMEKMLFVDIVRTHLYIG